jgi:hypothetical protein
MTVNSVCPGISFLDSQVITNIHLTRIHLKLPIRDPSGFPSERGVIPLRVGLLRGFLIVNINKHVDVCRV